MSGFIERTTFPFPSELASCALIDVRSPLEFKEDAIPGAINLPVLNNTERVKIGTLFKQVSAFEARKQGAALISRNIAQHLEDHFAPKNKTYRPLLYCWRGGQRSTSMAMVLSQIGWHVSVLEGGYRTYRRHVNTSLTELPESLSFFMLNGLTGSGKTRILRELKTRGEQVLDLEDLASHKGSIFGGDPHRPQPAQKRFESLLYAEIKQFVPTRPVYIEAESAKIGKLNLPNSLWQKMKLSPVIELSSPVDSRARFLFKEYREWLWDTDRVIRTIERLKSFHSSQRIAEWMEMARKGKWLGLIEALLTVHYDHRYRPENKPSAFQKPLFRVLSEIDKESATAFCADEIQKCEAWTVSSSQEGTPFIRFGW